jgi:hypothetical protein
VVGLCNVTSVMVGLCQVAFNGSEKSSGHGKQQSARASCRRLSGAGSDRLMDAKEMGGESDTATKTHGRYYVLRPEEAIAATDVNTWDLSVGSAACSPCMNRKETSDGQSHQSPGE